MPVTDLQVGTVRRAGDAYDDEFDYVFEGGKRDGTFHKQVNASGPRLTGPCSSSFPAPSPEPQAEEYTEYSLCRCMA